MANLRIPGPTPCPPEVLAAAGSEMINHRGPEMAALQERVSAGAQPFFGTSGEVMLISASGTGAMEAVVTNLLSPGDRVLSVSVGSFGDRFGSIAETYGAEVTRMSVEWGKAAAADAVAAAAEEAEADAVLLTHNETSTGVTNPIAELAAAAREAVDPLIIVDAVSSLGSIEMEMDAWGLDAVATASQKGWLSPPGVSMAALSERGWAATETSTMPNFYFDLGKHREFQSRGQPPWTPTLPVLYAMDAALPIMMAEGPEAIFAKHHRFGAWTRATVKAMGLTLLADEAYASDTVTAVRMPEGVDGSSLTRRLREQYDVVVAGGQGKLSGQIFRIGHLGWLDEGEMSECFRAVQQALTDEGFAPAAGAELPGLPGD